MGIWIIIGVSMLWSFVGIFVKVASLMFDSATISFLRFFIGFIILAIIYQVKLGPIRIRSDNRWVWTGAIGKSANYFFENIAILLGLSYAFIVATPISYVLLLLLSVFLLKESVSLKDWIGAGLALIGVAAIMMNGHSISEMVSKNGFANLLFVISGIGVAIHSFSQKKLVHKIKALPMNISIFFWCTVITAIPLPWMFEFKQLHVGAIVSIMILGAITGLSFYWFAQALLTVPLFIATIVSSTNVLFTVLWGVVIYHEPVSWHVLIGVLFFICGLAIANWPKHQSKYISE